MIEPIKIKKGGLSKILSKSNCSKTKKFWQNVRVVNQRAKAVI